MFELSREGLVSGLLSRLLFLSPLFRLVAPYGASSRRAQKPMVMRVVTGNSADDRALDAALIRRGSTASHPAVDFDVDGVATTVIDAACFPGSSGSPVILHNFGNYASKTGATVIGTRTYFLGVLYSGPSMEADGKIVIRNIPTATEQVAQIQMMMNLGYITKTKEIAALGTEVLKKFGLNP